MYIKVKDAVDQLLRLDPEAILVVGSNDSSDGSPVSEIFEASYTPETDVYGTILEEVDDVGVATDMDENDEEFHDDDYYDEQILPCVVLTALK